MRLVAWQPDDLLRRLDDVVTVYGEAMGYRQELLQTRRGYIGAHVVHAMAAAGEQVVVLDDLSTGDPGRLAELPGVPLVVGSVRDRGLVRRVLREHAVQGVVHVAGKKQVAESVADPLTYYAENVEGLVALLESCRAKGVARFHFANLCGRPLGAADYLKIAH